MVSATEKQHICPRCGARFDCMANTDVVCHCEKVILDKAVLGHIAENFTGCLCHDCLMELRKEQQVE